MKAKRLSSFTARVRAGLLIIAAILHSIFGLNASRFYCPKSHKNVTLVYDFFPNEVENITDKLPETLADLQGFNIDFFRAFFEECPDLNYTLKRMGLQDQIDNLHDKNLSFITLNLQHGRNYTLFHVSQPVMAFPSCVVYIAEFSTHPSPTLVLRYVVAYVMFSLFGLLVFMLLERLEVRGEWNRNYADVAWKFLLSPFGLCDDGVSKTPSMKIFLFTWLIVWFLMMGFFWAELSSDMTVSKIQDEFKTFQDVLKSKRKFFWNDGVSSMHAKVVDDLRKRYEEYADQDHRDYEQFYIEDRMENITEKLLKKGEILLILSIKMRQWNLSIPLFEFVCEQTLDLSSRYCM